MTIEFVEVGVKSNYSVFMHLDWNEVADWDLPTTIYEPLQGEVNSLLGEVGVGGQHCCDDVCCCWQWQEWRSRW